MMRNGSRKATCRVLVMQNCTTPTSEVIFEMMSPLRWSLKKPTCMSTTFENISLRMRCSVRVRMFSTVQEPR